MNFNDSEFTNLTKAQVEALQECFDFLRNGYMPLLDSVVCGTWIIKLRHRHNGSCISVWIHRWSYVILRDGKMMKVVRREPDKGLYSVSVDSDMNLKVKNLPYSAGQKFDKV